MAKRQGSCDACGLPFETTSPARRWCSAECRATQRMRPCGSCAEMVHVSRTSAAVSICLDCRRGAPGWKPRARAVPDSRTCQQCGASFVAVGNQKFCRAACRIENLAERRRSPSLRTEAQYVGALAFRNGAAAPEAVTVRCTLTIGVLVRCPHCAAVMAAATLEVRICPTCGTEAHVNVEELALAHVAA